MTKNELLAKLELQTKEEAKHLKGYMFDSLVYRYKLARQKMTEIEIIEDSRSTSPRYDREYFLRLEKRDIQRFIEILDEAIGAHD